MRRATWAGAEWHWTRWGWGIIGWPGRAEQEYHACAMLGPVTLNWDFDKRMS